MPKTKKIETDTATSGLIKASDNLLAEENTALHDQVTKLQATLAAANARTIAEPVEKPRATVDLSSVESQMAEMREMIASLATSVSRDAKNVPAIISKDQSEDVGQHTGQHGTAAFTEDAGLAEDDASLILSAPENVESPESKAKFEALAFNEEYMTIRTQGPTNPDLPMLFDVTNNGTSVVLAYDGEYRIKRKYVEVLARAKQTTLQNIEYIRPDGVKAVKWPSVTTLRYGFSVVEDANPKGAAWLSAIMKQP